MAKRSTVTRPDPREIASLCRRVASIPTSGGHHADRVLLELAQELENRELERPARESRDRETGGKGDNR